MLNLYTPSDEEAWQFAVMLRAGMPSIEALVYFHPDLPQDDLRAVHDKWIKSQGLQKAIEKLQGKAWQKMTLKEQLQTAIDNHYAQLAYFLYSRNYTELQGTDRQKADAARAALEAKIAGNAGKMDALSQFFEDVQLGKRVLPAIQQKNEIRTQATN